MTLAWTTLALAPSGDDLHAACVRAGARGVAIDEAVLPSFLAMPDAEAAQALRSICPHRRVPGRVVVVCPSEWCAARPVAITTEQWGGARDEVLRSIDQMLPVTPSDAIIGVVDVFPDAPGASSAAGGCLVGARSSLVRRWLDPLERALGRRVDCVLTPQMAALGLGLQRESEASVVEPGPGADAIRLRDGRVVGVMERPGPGPRRLLPGCSPDDAGEPVTPGELAAAGAIAERVAPDSFRPLAGRLRSGARKWVGPAAAAALAAACIAGGFLLADARRAEAIDTLRAERASLEDRFEESRRLSERIERLQRLLDDGVATVTRDWRSPLSTMRDIAGAVERPAFLYRMEVGPRSVRLVGEAGEVRVVLQRLEESERLRSAALTDTLMPSPTDDTLDVFTISADRVETGVDR